MFKTVGKDVFEGECPFCGNVSFKIKMDDKYYFLCHDCQRLKPFSSLKLRDSEILVNDRANYSSMLQLCTKVSDLPSDHFCRKYCEGRKLPLDLVYYTEQFSKLADYAGIKVKDNKRLILPFFDEDGKLFALQGRAFEPGAIRYLTVLYDKSKEKVFGLDRVDFNETVTVVEGPIDSFFVKNAIAMAGSAGLNNKYFTNSVICYDNEPRNKAIVNKVKKSIDQGFKTVIWPTSLTEKDINDMVLAGYDVNQLILDHTYSGLQAAIKFNEWKRV